MLYTPEQAEALRRAFPNLQPVDQYGVLERQPRAVERGLPAARHARSTCSRRSRPTRMRKVAEKAAESWVALFRQLDGNPAAQAAIRDAAAKTFWPRLQQLGFTPRDGEPPLDSLLRAALIADLGYVGEPHVLGRKPAAVRCLAARSQGHPRLAQGRVARRRRPECQCPDLGSVAPDRRRTRGTIERSAYYQQLGRAKDDALARRGLELAITKEPGATVSAAMIAAAAENHPVMAFDFVLSHLAQVRPLIDLSVGSRVHPGPGRGQRRRGVIPSSRLRHRAHTSRKTAARSTTPSPASLEGGQSAAHPARVDRLAKARRANG